VAFSSALRPSNCNSVRIRFVLLGLVVMPLSELILIINVDGHSLAWVQDFIMSS
jgi:hypothetical protein